MYSFFEYNEGMKSTQLKQYTVRNLTSALDRKLKQEARESGRSLNEVVLEALYRGAGLSEAPLVAHDLDCIIGSWKDDPAFDEALKLQDTIDEELWS